MGADTLIAIAALVLAVIALVQARRSASPRPTITAAARHGTARTDGSGERSPQAEEPTLQRLVATVRTLELQLNEHETLLCSLVTDDEARHLWNIAKDGPTLYERHPGVEGELRTLVRRGLLAKRGNFKIHELASSFDIREHFELTASGHLLLSLRKHLESADTQPAESLPPGSPHVGSRDARPLDTTTGDTTSDAPRPPHFS